MKSAVLLDNDASIEYDKLLKFAAPSDMLSPTVAFCALIEPPVVLLANPTRSSDPVVRRSSCAPSNVKVFPEIACATSRSSVTVIDPLTHE